MHRPRHAGVATDAHDRAGLLVQLGGAPVHQIAVHRRGGPHGHRIDPRERRRDRLLRHRHPASDGDRAHFTHRLREQRARLRNRAHDIDRRARDRPDAAERLDEEQLAPQRDLDLRRDRHRRPSLPQHAPEPGDAIARSPARSPTVISGAAPT